jgi:WD40 repeat protein
VSPAFTLNDPGSTGVTSVTFTASGNLIAGDLNGSAYLWQIGDVQPEATFPSTNGQGIFGVSLNPSGTILATATVNNPSYTKGGVVLWNTATRKPRATLTDPGGHGSGTPGAFTKDGTILAVADSNGEIYLWNPDTAKLTGTLPNPDSQSGQSANWLAFSPRTDYLAAGDGDGTTYLWNIQTRKLVTTFQDPDTHNGINTIAFSPDGTTLATGDGNGNVYLWNVATGALTATLRSPSGDAIGGVAFSPTDGALAVTANNAKDTQNSIYIWNAAHKLVATFHDPNSEAAYRLAFSPDGRYLAAADANAHTYLWNMTWLNP